MSLADKFADATEFAALCREQARSPHIASACAAQWLCLADRASRKAAQYKRLMRAR